jgi:hypothetical protein
MKTFLALLVSGALLATLGCSGGSSSGADAGAGGSIGTGGGSTGTGGTAGASGIAGRAGTGGVAGQSGATGGQGGVTALGGSGGHAGGGAGGGSGGHGGGGARGGISCGKNVCGAGDYCCSQSCSLCAPIGSLCIAIACTDAGVTSDAGACAAVPAQDSSCTASATPHSYRCILSTLPPPCVAQAIGDVTNTFCCP